MKDILYDRQLRLWGEEGQSSIEATSVCVLGSSSLASEILKSLVLSGIKSFCILDDSIITDPDVGQNFFLTKDDIGKNRAEVVTSYLKELRPTVVGFSLILSPHNIKDEVLEKLQSFSVVVATNISDSACSKISSKLYAANIPFISARVYGFLGYIRIAVNEHTVANNHDENLRPDLRLDCPFEELNQFVKSSTGLTEMTSEEVKHTPYLLLYFKALDEYRTNVGDSKAFPSTFSERKQFLQVLLSMRLSCDSEKVDTENFDEAKTALHRSLQRTTIPGSVQDILNDSKCSSESKCQEPFWLICTALRRFVERHGVLPLAGSIPDMTSDSVRYTKLASVYHEKALDDAKEIHSLTKEVEQEREVGDIISFQQCYTFCKNAAKTRVIRGSSIENESYESIIQRIADTESEDGEVTLPMWLLLLKAADLFSFQKMRYPGTNGVPCTIDAYDLKQRIKILLDDSKAESQNIVFNKIPSSAIDEICRYGAAEPHVISALMGGIAAQEVIKLATNQYVPLNNTLVYDGHTQMTETFQL